MDTTDYLSCLNGFLNQPNTFDRNLNNILLIGGKIVEDFDDKDKIYGDAARVDELRPILAAIAGSASTQELPPLEADLLLAKILKVLLRKPVNRLSLGKNGLTTLVRSLNRLHAERKGIVAAEMCNVILNTCYDGANVQLFLEVEGLKPLVLLLRSRDPVVLASALGVIQGLCYVPSGRQRMRQETKVFNTSSVKYFGVRIANFGSTLCAI